MKIAVCSDEPHLIHEAVLGDLKCRKHRIVLFGALRDGKEASWVEVTEEVKKLNCLEKIL